MGPLDIRLAAPPARMDATTNEDSTPPNNPGLRQV